MERYGKWLKIGYTSPRCAASQIARFINTETRERLWVETSSWYGYVPRWMSTALEANDLQEIERRGRLVAQDSPGDRMEYPWAPIEWDRRSLERLLKAETNGRRGKK